MILQATNETLEADADASFVGKLEAVGAHVRWVEKHVALATGAGRCMCRRVAPAPGRARGWSHTGTARTGRVVPEQRPDKMHELSSDIISSTRSHT